MIKKIIKAAASLLIAALITLFAGIILLKYFLMPVIEKKVRQAVLDSLGKRAEMAQVKIKLPEAIVLVKGLKIDNSDLANYTCRVTINEATLHIGLIGTFFQKRPILDHVDINGAVIVLERKGSLSGAPASNAFPGSTSAQEASQSDTGERSFNELYIRKLTAKNLEFTLKDYSLAKPPAIIQVVNIDGEIDDFLISFRVIGNFTMAIHFTGYFNSAQKGSFKVKGTIAKRGNEVDFDLKSEIHNADLTYFSPYYDNTSFTILKEARVDIDSDAMCRSNELKTCHNAHIYAIKLNNILPTSQDTLFSLPAATVINFFNDYHGEVKFSFNIGGTLRDLKFEPDPTIKEVISKALGDRIAARLRELPRDVVKISEKAVKGDIDLGKESKMWIEGMEERLEAFRKDLKKKHEQQLHR